MGYVFRHLFYILISWFFQLRMLQPLPEIKSNLFCLSQTENSTTKILLALVSELLGFGNLFFAVLVWIPSNYGSLDQRPKPDKIDFH